MSLQETKDTIRIEALTTLEQFQECVALQDAVWGYDITGKMTQKVYLLASQIGGQVIGAYDGETLAGYALALPGVRDGRSYLHSHHLAVLPQWRNAGTGRRLKLAQREDALQRGIEWIEWTYDPLESKNAYLNLARLGAISRRYKRNFYGPSTSPLHGGLPTDRMYAEWWLRSERVTKALAGEKLAVQATEHVDVPAKITEWKANEALRHRAREAQEKIAAALEDAFSRGLAATGFERMPNGDGRYLLAPWNEDLKN